MAHCVFMHRADSIYDDQPDRQYQFPKRYLGRASQSQGDWIIYLEPRKVQKSRGYFAVARVQTIVPDVTSTGMFLAVIEPRTYLEFPSPVPFSEGGAPVELGLLNPSGSLSGRAQAAVRPVSDADFVRIVERGLGDASEVLERTQPLEPVRHFDDEQAPFIFDSPRQRILQLSSRVFRDRIFRKAVLLAYDERCAISGLKLINGGGRAEVNAAHIKPVERDGPDTVNNGIALSGTAHWMFDRGLVSLDDDCAILISRQANNPDEIRSFVNPTGIAFLPKTKRDHPHPRFLAWHRENVFKQ